MPRKCSTKFCRNTAAPQRTKCHKCRRRQKKINNPIAYTFDTLKNNAKRRGKDFSLTLDQFKLFISENDYMALKGKTKTALQIDRIDVTKGYHADNIRAITTSANARKRHVEYTGYGTKSMEYAPADDEFAASKLPDTDENYVPF